VFLSCIGVLKYFPGGFGTSVFTTLRVPEENISLDDWENMADNSQFEREFVPRWMFEGPLKESMLGQLFGLIKLQI
jgi:hypothetical protein